MNSHIILSIVIPCRNEAKHIAKCLDSIIANDFPKERLEVFVVDGMSDDGTRDIVNSYTRERSFIRLLDNERRVTPVAMNLGIKESQGANVMILSSHSAVHAGFLRANVKALEEHPADCVGGVLVTLSGGDSVIARAISLVLSHPFGVGNVYFRIGSDTPRYVDTVPFGCYRRDVFDRIGLFDEDLVRNQDDEFNYRLLQHGGKILLVPEIVSSYYGRDSLWKLWRMYYQYGYFKPLVAEKLKAVLSWRQVVPALFVTSLMFAAILAPVLPAAFLLLLFVAGSYGIANVATSLSLSRRAGLKFLGPLMVAFGTVHFSYGLGYLRGIIDFRLRKKHRCDGVRDIGLTR